MGNKNKQQLSNDGKPPLAIKEEVKNRPHIPYILNGELYRIESQIGDNVIVKCCNCPPDRVYRGSVRSTGNFHMHIKRRHSSLLGKLHEMKVAALVERRDRIMMNRANRPKKIKNQMQLRNDNDVMVPQPGVQGTLPEVKQVNHELKIKTVFQRHKQEQHKLEEAATSRVIAAPPLDQNENITKNDNNNNMNNYTQNLLGNMEHSPNTSHDSEPYILGTTNTYTPANQIATVARLLTLSTVKPEHQAACGTEPEPEAIDLSMGSNSSGQQTQGSNYLAHVSGTNRLAHYADISPRDVFARIDNTLKDIKMEMQLRNLIEQRRLQLEVAKFKITNPNFSFQFNP